MLNNDDNSIKNVWSLQNPTLEEGWIIGRVQIVPDGEKEYQVRCVGILCCFLSKYILSLPKYEDIMYCFYF